jgi:glycosyltransferase involved in cell wall biosynthesis
VKVAHLVIGGEIAGGQLVALQLVRALRERGDEVLVVSPTPGPFVDLLEREGVDVHRIDVSRTFHVREAVRLARVLRSERVDLLHTHTAVAANVLSRLAGRVAGIRVITHMHIENYFRPQRIGRVVHATLDNATSRLATRIIAVSDDTRKALVKQGVPERLIVTVHNGIEPVRGGARRGREALGLPPEGRLIGSIARLAAVKGQRELIEAFAELAGDRPDVALVLVGKDLEQAGSYQRELEGHARALGIADRVTFTGYREDADQLLEEFDVFALPSWIEGLPMVVLEAMAHGKPVVATPVGGTPELVVEGETGLLVPARDAAALEQALARLLDDPDERRRLGEAGRARVERDFTAKAMVERVFALYDEALST